MPSTYTTNLRLEQIGIGEADNAWGDKLNNDIVLLDDAITGIATVSTTGGSTTLTTNNAAADEARRAIIKITGTLVSNATIIIPDKTKKYTVWNATSGAYTVTVKASSTGVVVNQGSVVNMICDGTVSYLVSDQAAAKTDVANSWTAQQTFKEVKDTVYTITDGAAFEIDPANGSVQIVTLGASRTPAATNFEAGQVVLLGIDDGTAYTVTWTTVNPTWVKQGGSASAPALGTIGYTWILLWKVSSTVYGVEVGRP